MGKDVQAVQAGDYVLLSFASCMSCSTCKKRQKGSCAHITRLNFGGARGLENSPIRLPDGRRARGQFFGQSSFSELAIVDVRSVVKYSGSEKDLEFLAPLGCGYMTGAGTIFNVLRPPADCSVAVFGLGAVGLAAVMAARHEGVHEIIAVDIVESKLELATSLGATQVINSKQADILDAIRRTVPDGLDHIIDTTGSTLLMNKAIKALGHAGTLALVGVSGVTDQIEASSFDLLTSSKRIIGVILGSADPQQVCLCRYEMEYARMRLTGLQLLPKLVEMVQSGSFPVNRLSTVYPAKHVKQAIADMKSGVVSALTIIADHFN